MCLHRKYFLWIYDEYTIWILFVDLQRNSKLLYLQLLFAKNVRLIMLMFARHIPISTSTWLHTKILFFYSYVWIDGIFDEWDILYHTNIQSNNNTKAITDCFALDCLSLQFVWFVLFAGLKSLKQSKVCYTHVSIRLLHEHR